MQKEPVANFSSLDVGDLIDLDRIEIVPEVDPGLIRQLRFKSIHQVTVTKPVDDHRFRPRPWRP